VLISTPEYNQAVPGVVKNMIDWLSLGDPPESLQGKPVAVTGITTGPWGTRLAQTMLRQMLVSSQAILLPQPFLYLRGAESLFDDNGKLRDDNTRQRLGELVVALGDWVGLLDGGNAVHGDIAGLARLVPAAS
jgi:chromate reductase